MHAVFEGVVPRSRLNQQPGFLLFQLPGEHVAHRVAGGSDLLILKNDITVELLPFHLGPGKSATSLRAPLQAKDLGTPGPQQGSQMLDAHPRPFVLRPAAMCFLDGPLQLR
jgi:hypothetical protein